MKLKRNGKIVKLRECPFCGHDEYYQRVIMSGVTEYYSKFNPENRFDSKGNEDCCENGHIHDGLTYREQKTLYCGACNKKVGFDVS